ncbi:MAG: metallophosphoesterase [Sulfurospirillum sp.]
MGKKDRETFVIGDVHGCYYTLLSLLEKLPKKSKLIFVGDLCDKGRYSKDVIEFVIQNNHLCVKGNHEYLMQTYIKKAILQDDMSSKWASAKGWGGKQTIENYRDDLDALDRHLKWIGSLPLYLEIDNFFITHGFGLPYYKRKHDKHSHSLFVNRIYDTTFIRDWEDFKTYETVNIFGHCNFREVLRGKNYACIDTGCCYGNKLTAINLKTLETVEQKTDKRDLL